jgi:uroporphyrinogen-III synthase
MDWHFLEARMHILITRPEPDASALGARLSALGATVTIDPLLEITLTPPGDLDLAGVQALVATSRNGLRGLAAAPAGLLARASALPLFTVGPGTADLGRELGFATVHAGPANARDLRPVIAAAASPSAGRLLHLCGDKLAYDLAGALGSTGLVLEQVVVYRSQPAAHLRPQTLAALAARHIDTIMLLSPLTAKTFVTLVTDAGIVEQSQELVYVCLSQAIAGQLTTLSPRHVVVAVQPNSEEMVSLVEMMAVKSAQRRI